MKTTQEMRSLIAETIKEELNGYTANDLANEKFYSIQGDDIVFQMTLVNVFELKDIIDKLNENNIE